MQQQGSILQQTLLKAKQDAQKLVDMGYDVTQVNAFARKTFPNFVLFPKKDGNKKDEVPAALANLLSAYEPYELSTLIMGFQQIVNIMEATPSALVKQALARGSDISITKYDPKDPKDVVLKQYRGARFEAVPHQYTVTITRPDGKKNYVPVYNGIMNSNFFAKVDDDSVTKMNQTLSSTLYFYTHFFQWDGTSFKQKTAWTAQELERFKLTAIWSPAHSAVFGGIALLLKKLINGSELATQFKNVKMAGNILTERLEYLLARNGDAYFQFMQWFADLFVPYNRKNDKGVVVKEHVLRPVAVKTHRGKEKIINLYYVPATWMSKMIPKFVAEKPWDIASKVATYDQAISELAAGRGKGGQNHNSQTTCSQREMLFGVHTGTQICDLSNLVSDLRVFDWAREISAALVTKNQYHTSLFLKALASFLTTPVTVEIPINYREKGLFEETIGNGLVMIANHNVRVRFYESLLSIASADPLYFEFVAKDDEVNGNKLGLIDACKNGLELLNKKKGRWVTRLPYAPSLFATNGIVCFNSMAIHNMVMWVTKNASLVQQELDYRYYLATHEKEYFWAVVAYNVLRQLIPIWQRDPAAILTTWGVKFPPTDVHIKGSFLFSGSFDTEGAEMEYVNYTSVKHRAEKILQHLNDAKTVSVGVDDVEDEESTAGVKGQGVKNDLGDLDSDSDEKSEEEEVVSDAEGDALGALFSAPVNVPKPVSVEIPLERKKRVRAAKESIADGVVLEKSD